MSKKGFLSRDGRVIVVPLVVALVILVLLTRGFGQTDTAKLTKSVRGAVSRAKHWLTGSDRPHVKWKTVDPTEEGLSQIVLDSLRIALAAESTAAFLVVRGNHIVYEWYGPSFGPNSRYPTAAMAKATTAYPVLLAAVTDGLLGLDESVARNIPKWQNDSLRSRIRIRDLAAHQSGIATEDFSNPSGWRQTYFAQRDQRFTLALETAPILSVPGERYRYSGIGYYVLAYALTRSLQRTLYPDLRVFLQKRIMEPLDIPDEDWLLSYGESYQLDGMTLYALGSGAEYTARAVARIGQLFLDYGRWDGREVLDSGLVAQSRQPATAMLPPDSAGYPIPPSAAAGGWWLNTRSTWPGLPSDGLVGMGAGHEIILVVPSLDLIMVRMGKALSSENEFTPALGARLFIPLMHAVVGPGTRMRPMLQPKRKDP